MYISIAFILFHIHIIVSKYILGGPKFRVSTKAPSGQKCTLMSQICKNKRISAIIRSTHRPRGPNFKGWNSNVNCFSYVRGRNAPFWCAAKSIAASQTGVVRGILFGGHREVNYRANRNLTEIQDKAPLFFPFTPNGKHLCVPASGQHLSEAVQWSRPAIKVLQPSQIGCVRDS